jgi:hypothetical protein
MTPIGGGVTMKKIKKQEIKSHEFELVVSANEEGDLMVFWSVEPEPLMIMDVIANMLTFIPDHLREDFCETTIDTVRRMEKECAREYKLIHGGALC